MWVGSKISCFKLFYKDVIESIWGYGIISWPIIWFSIKITSHEYKICFSAINIKLRWCRTRDLLGSQIPVTTGGFELRISCISRARHHRSLKLGSKLQYSTISINYKFLQIVNKGVKYIWSLTRGSISETT